MTCAVLCCSRQYRCGCSGAARHVCRDRAAATIIDGRLPRSMKSALLSVWPWISAASACCCLWWRRKPDLSARHSFAIAVVGWRQSPRRPFGPGAAPTAHPSLAARKLWSSRGRRVLESRVVILHSCPCCEGVAHYPDDLLMLRLFRLVLLSCRCCLAG
jgi:hypothetical protein